MKLGGHVQLTVLKVSKNFERNRPLVGANKFFGSVITCPLTYPHKMHII